MTNIIGRNNTEYNTALNISRKKYTLNCDSRIRSVTIFHDAPVFKNPHQIGTKMRGIRFGGFL